MSEQRGEEGEPWRDGEDDGLERGREKVTW